MHQICPASKQASSSLETLRKRCELVKFSRMGASAPTQLTASGSLRMIKHRKRLECWLQRQPCSILVTTKIKEYWPTVHHTAKLHRSIYKRDWRTVQVKKPSFQKRGKGISEKQVSKTSWKIKSIRAKWISGLLWRNSIKSLAWKQWKVLRVSCKNKLHICVAWRHKCRARL